MWSSLQEYHRPANLPKALRLLERTRPRTVPLAGGTWLLARREPHVQAVIDLSALGLSFVRQQGRRLRVGAMTTLQTVATHPAIQAVAQGVLSDAARSGAPRALRNVATLGGTLVSAGSESALALALLLLDARVVVRVPARRTVDIETFLAGRGGVLPPAGLVLEVAMPLPRPGCGAALADVRRTPRDLPIVAAGALVWRRGARCRGARLALAGVGPHPLRLHQVETSLAGGVLEEDSLARVAREIVAALPLGLPADARASAEYRREMAGVAARRALGEAWRLAL